MAAGCTSTRHLSRRFSVPPSVPRERSRRRMIPQSPWWRYATQTVRSWRWSAGQTTQASQFNLATQGRRQPGSAFKPFVLVAALEKGVKPNETFSAAPLSVPVKDGTWNVENYENAYTGGSLSLHEATNWSVNAVYARLIMKVGPQRVVEVARKMGISSPLEPNPAIALGGLSQGVSPLEMSSAFGTLANGGVRVKPNGIGLVTDDDGRLVLDRKMERKRVLKKPVAVEAGLMLHDVVEHGTGRDARIGRWAAGKTGHYPVLSGCMVRGVGGRHLHRGLGWLSRGSGRHDRCSRHQSDGGQLPGADLESVHEGRGRPSRALLTATGDLGCAAGCRSSVFICPRTP